MDDRSDVVLLAAQQRAAEPGEPTCAVCGRYGEYICDATDDDVCSLECRDICTEKHQKECERKTMANVTAAPTTELTSRTSTKRMAPTEGAEDSSDDAVHDHHDPEQAVVDAAVAAEIRKRLQIHVDVVGGSSSPFPSLCDSFESLPPQLKVNIAAKGYEHLTPVQMQTIPVALTGVHVLVSAPTGTGKTAAFLIPMVVQIMETRFNTQHSVALGLVLAPIRELVIQIEHEAKALMKGIKKMKTALVVGGLPLPPQLHRLRQGVQLVVATPGRLVDILVHHGDNGLEHLIDHVRCCVVDEVDMMLNVGFHEAVTQILGSLPTSPDPVQLIFTSATVSKHVEAVVSSCLGSSVAYVRIRIGNNCVSDVGTSLTLDSNVNHSLRWLEENDKKTELFHLLRGRGLKPTLVFVDSKVGADMLAQAIQRQHSFLQARSFHAGKSQHERLQILEEFVDEKVHVLVTTNVMGRGIDLLTVDCVVIFDAPKSIMDYVHLVGRVGRGGIDNEADRSASIMYLNARDTAILPELVRIFRQHRLKIPEQVYRSVRAKGPTNIPLTVVDDAKRAFHVVHELEGHDLSNRASEWGLWKYSFKRSRYT